MPIILELKYTDGSSEIKYIPAEIWRKNASRVHKVIVSQKELKEVVLDPYLETADTDRNNNYFPARNEPTRFEMFNGKDQF